MINRKSIVNSPDDRLRQFNRMPIPTLQCIVPLISANVFVCDERVCLCTSVCVCDKPVCLCTSTL